MAKTINIDINADATSIVELRKQIKAVKDELLSASDPEQMSKLAERAGELNDKFKDMNEQVAIFSEGSPFAKASNALGAVGSELASLDFEGAAERAMVLQKTISNITPEQVTKQMKGLQDTMGILGKTGGQALGGLLKNIGGLAKGFLSFGKALLMNPIFLIATAVIAIVAGIVALLSKLGLLKPILEAIGAVFGFIGDILDAIVQGFKDFTDWLGLTNNAEIDGAEKSAKAWEKRATAASNYAERAIIGIDGEIERAKILGKNTEELERKKVYLILWRSKIEKKAAEEALRAAILKGDLDDEEIQKLKDKVRETKNAYLAEQQNAKTFEVQQAQNKKDARNKEAEEDEKANQEAIERAKENARKIAEERKNALNSLRKFEQGILDDRLSDEEKEKLAVKRKYDEQIAIAKKYGQDVTILQNGLANELKAIDDKYRKGEEEKRQSALDFIKNINAPILSEVESAREKENEIYNKRLDDLNKFLVDKNITEEEYRKAKENAEKEHANNISKINSDQQAKDFEVKLNNFIKETESDNTNFDERRNKLLSDYAIALNDESLNQEQLLELKKKYNEASKDIDEDEKLNRRALIDFTLKSIKSGLDTLVSLTETFGGKSKSAQKRQFELQKKASIATALINTYQGAASAFANQTGGVVVKSIAAGLAVASGLANVAKISKTQFEGGSPDSSSTTPTSSPSTSIAPSANTTPNINLFGNANQFNNVGSPNSANGNAQNNMVITAVVSETEMTATQNRIKTIKESSKL